MLGKVGFCRHPAAPQLTPAVQIIVTTTASFLQGAHAEASTSVAQQLPVHDWLCMKLMPQANAVGSCSAWWGVCWGWSDLGFSRVSGFEYPCCLSALPLYLGIG